MNDKPDAARPSVFPLDLALPDLLDSLPDGAYITDTNRQILFWNKAAERITGWRAKDVIGRNCSDNILAHVDKDGHALCGCDHCPLHRSIVTAQPSTEPMVVFARRKYGISAPVEVSVAPIRDRQGNVIGGIEIFRDMTDSMQDLLRAKGIQEQAIACSLPQDRRLQFEMRYQPREIVGGDFYRIERLTKNHYALLIADAMGHGVAAALHTMQLRALWDDCRHELQSPARFLAAINRRVHALVRDAGYFATAVCVSYNAETGEVRCVRAGHPTPLLFRRGGVVEPVGPPQLALGMLPVASYLEASLRMDPGDALLLFTDGAVELFDPLQQELGTEGLKQLVLDQNVGQSPGEFGVDVLEQQLLKFSNGIHLPDDLTLIKLRRLV
jgi:sigma-B regulation protein RsbU (phosphoserine phosphatase)